MSVLTVWANQLAAGKIGIARLLAIEYHCPGLPEPGRYAALNTQA